MPLQAPSYCLAQVHLPIGVPLPFDGSLAGLPLLPAPGARQAAVSRLRRCSTSWFRTCSPWHASSFESRPRQKNLLALAWKSTLFFTCCRRCAVASVHTWVRTPLFLPEMSSSNPKAHVSTLVCRFSLFLFPSPYLLRLFLLSSHWHLVAHRVLVAARCLFWPLRAALRLA